eukprot:TRINITY_DN23568_c0_g1_i1.p1 TRINITY_DN23568_c0_g1~~TRINITY_DN23568_c0_g1_i1.p1  ORF type:complete len:392 (+),score=101.24 TRINITY_DN23568_c0_g1_i1:146-1177(+)
MGELSELRKYLASLSSPPAPTPAPLAPDAPIVSSPPECNESGKRRHAANDCAGMGDAWDCALFKHELKVKERSGVVRVLIRYEAHHLEAVLRVPPRYPVDPPAFALKKHSLDGRLEASLTAAVNTLIRRFNDGHTDMYKLPWLREHQEESDGIAPSGPSVSDLHQFRHDMQFLKTVKELNAHSDDKKVRQHKKYLLKKEAQKELSLLALEQQQQQTSFREATQDPKPSVFASVHLLLTKFFADLVCRLCTMCGGRLLPADPSALRQPKYPLYPEDLTCGHWFHDSCLKDYVCKPPFHGKTCPDCGESLNHRKYNAQYTEKAEKRWAVKQAKRRELEDIMEFLD